MTERPPDAIIYSMKTGANHAAKGFTLVEILCVIVIGMLLLVLIVPVYKKCVLSTEIIQCTSNLRISGNATLSAAQDRGWQPFPVRWQDVVADYMPEKTKPSICPALNRMVGRRITGFALNTWMRAHSSMGMVASAYPLLTEQCPGVIGVSVEDIRKGKVGMATWVNTSDYANPSKILFLFPHHSQGLEKWAETRGGVGFQNVYFRDGHIALVNQKGFRDGEIHVSPSKYK